ncbi:MAG: hypothetical protein QM692_13430 [Thermomicrobiales bacterium]
MARNPVSAPHDNQQPEDAWSRAWGSVALQRLGRYLVASGSPEEHAAVIVEQIWLFYSYTVLPVTKHPDPLGIAAWHANETPRIRLVLMQSPESRHSHAEADRLSTTFRDTVAQPMASWVSIDLHTVQIPVQPVDSPHHSEQRLEVWLRRMIGHAAAFAAVYLDDLRAEFGALMGQDEAAVWLATPNTLFGGLAPQFLIGTPDEHLLRDVVTRAKFNLPAA